MENMQQHQHRRPVFSSFYSHWPAHRLRKLTTLPAASTRFYVSVNADKFRPTPPSSPTPHHSTETTDGSAARHPTNMDVAKKLRKFLQRRLNGNGEETGCRHSPQGACCMNCQWCRQNWDDAGMEKKIKKLLRTMNPETWSSSQSQDRKTYATIMSVLLSQYGGRGQPVEQRHSTQSAPDQPEQEQVKNAPPVTTGQQQVSNKEDLSNEPMVRVFACTISRPNYTDSFGLQLQCSREDTGQGEITSVDQDSPASTANLKSADRVIAVNGQRLERSSDMEAVLDQLLEAKLVIERIEGQDENSTVDDPPSAALGTAQDSSLDGQEEPADNAPRSSRSRSTVHNDEEDLERWLDRVRVYPRGTIMDRFPEARAFLRLMGRGTYSEDYRDCNV